MRFDDVKALLAFMGREHVELVDYGSEAPVRVRDDKLRALVDAFNANDDPARRARERATPAPYSDKNPRVRDCADGPFCKGACESGAIARPDLAAQRVGA